MKLRLKGHAPILSPPPPPPPPPAGGSYPAAVIAADTALGGTTMRGVWDLYTTAGCRVAQASLTPIASATVPGTVTRAAGAVTVNGAWTGSNIDFGGSGIFCLNGTVLDLTDCSIPASSSMRFWLGETAGASPSGSAAASLHYVTIDMTNGDTTGGHALITGLNASQLTVANSKILNSPRALIDWGTTTSLALTMTDTVLGAFATNTATGDHTESIQFLGGTGTFTRVLIDPGYGLPQVPAAATGPIFFEATSATVNVTLTNCIILCPSSAGIYTFQCKANNNNVNVTLTNCILQKGSSGYHDLTHVGANVVTVTNGGGNYDFDTALPILSGL